MSYFNQDVPDIVMRSLFCKYDKDNSGNLIIEELKPLLKDELGLTEDQAQAYILLLDTDGNKKVSYEEFTAWLRSGERFKTVNCTSRFYLVKKAVELFKSFDKDNSNALDEEEFKQLMISLGRSPDESADALRSLDNDGNGRISFVEFLKWLNWVPVDSFN